MSSPGRTEPGGSDGPRSRDGGFRYPRTPGDRGEAAARARTEGAPPGAGRGAARRDSASSRIRPGLRPTSWRSGAAGRGGAGGGDRARPGRFTDGYGGRETSYYWDGDEYWVDGGSRHGPGGRHHRYHSYRHHRPWAHYFHHYPYYWSYYRPWYDHWYDPGWCWYDGFSLWYYDNSFGLFFRWGHGRRFYLSLGAFYYRYPRHYLAPVYHSYYDGLGYPYGYYSYVVRSGHFGWWDYYPRTTVVYETYIPTQAPVEREAVAEAPDGNVIDNLMLQAEEAFGRGDYLEAIRFLEQALAITPDSYQIHLALAVAHGAAGQYQQAAERIRVGVSLAGDGDPLVQDLRTLYGNDELLAEHLALIGEAVRADPTSSELRLVHAFFLLGADRAQAARSALEILTSRESGDRVLQDLMRMADERIKMGLEGNEPIQSLDEVPPAPTPEPVPAPPSGGANPPPPGAYY